MGKYDALDSEVQEQAPSKYAALMNETSNIETAQPAAQPASNEPAWYDVGAKLKKTMADTGAKIDREGELNAQGKESGVAGGLWSMLHAGSGIVRGLGDIVSPVVSNPVSKAIIGGLGEGLSYGSEPATLSEAVKNDSVLSKLPVEEEAPAGFIVDAGAYMRDHPEVGNRFGSAFDVASALPIGGGAKVVKEITADALPEVVNSARSGIADALTGAAKNVNDFAGKYSQETSGVSEAALRKAGTKEGRQELKEAYGTQSEIGTNLSDAINNAWDKVPNSDQIKTALQNVPDINVQPFIDKLTEALPSAKTSEMKAVSDKINGKISDLQDFASQYNNGGAVPAQDLFDFRKELDDIINDSWGKESGKYVNALKDVRYQIKNSLIENAKGTDYEATMQDVAKKMDALDNMKRILGKSVDTRDDRAESFIRNINNLGKDQKREWLQNFQDVFGGDYLDQAKTAQLAEQMGNEGQGSWLPRWTTGRSMLSKGAGLAFGSPKIASRITLPSVDKVTGAVSSLGDLIRPR